MNRPCIIALCILLAGCANGLVCRHTVMADAAWAVENGQTPEIVVYEVSPAWSLGIYNAHAQVRTDQGWITEIFGMVTIDPNPAYPPVGWQKSCSVDEYMRLMARRCFDRADCRDAGIPY